MDNFYDNNDNNRSKLIEMGFDEDYMLDEIKLIKEEINDITDKKIIERVKIIEKSKNRIIE